ncbi:uncharacterized protein KGF55_004182 [Candida pseudojiufengensis]|uniref:uncharacterized protein n=1 Tax=Candida pseudojiufengensis TaxID=497109 RepID=UPI0022252F84|nr:uncharacterized protein KGF55_004182 [Candida pseudojiufengensis]KAI5961257.1 hypothetical protein KGF55_004182 [Candida pseudojiufengensis]
MSRSNFNLIDIVRIFGGILLFNAILSYWFTSDTTWGYHGKYINWRFYKHKLLQPQLHLTLDELSEFDGIKKYQILLAINGSVFDVTSNWPVYGPKGTYHKLVAKDASRVFITGCFMKPDEYTYDMRGLDPEECRSDIKKWQEFFKNHGNYWYVGEVELNFDVLKNRPPPEPCEHMKFPGMSH